MMTRKFSSISIETALASPLSNTATSLTVTSSTGAALMGGVSLAAGDVDQFMVALDPDTINEELVAITSVSGDTFTIVRGQGGTSAVSHSVGAKVQHVLTGDDLTAFEATTTAVDSKIDYSAFTARGQILVATGNGTFVALPVGSNNQVLSADNAEASGVKWAAIPSSGGSVPGSAYSAKGVVLVGTGSGTYAAVSVGSDGQLLVADSAASAGVKWASSPLVAVSSQTASYTLVLSDAGKNVEVSSSSATTITVPTNTSVAFPVGTQLLITQIGSGTVSVAGDTGVTVQSNGSKTNLNGQFAQATLIKRDTNTWILSGNLA